MLRSICWSRPGHRAFGLGPRDRAFPGCDLPGVVLDRSPGGCGLDAGLATFRHHAGDDWHGHRGVSRHDLCGRVNAQPSRIRSRALLRLPSRDSPISGQALKVTSAHRSRTPAATHLVALALGWRRSRCARRCDQPANPARIGRQAAAVGAALFVVAGQKRLAIALRIDDGLALLSKGRLRQRQHQEHGRDEDFAAHSRSRDRNTFS